MRLAYAREDTTNTYSSWTDHFTTVDEAGSLARVLLPSCHSFQKLHTEAAGLIEHHTERYRRRRRFPSSLTLLVDTSKHASRSFLQWRVVLGEN